MSTALQPPTAADRCELTEPLGLTQPTISHHLVPGALDALAAVLTTIRP